MPNLLKKGAASRVVKHEEKKTLLGLLQQPPNRLDHYLIVKPAAAPGMLANANNLGPGYQRVSGNNPPPERFHSNRLTGQDKQYPPFIPEKKLMGQPPPVQSRSEAERIKMHKVGGAPLRFQGFAGYRTTTTGTTATTTSGYSHTDSISGAFRRLSNNSYDSEEESTASKMDIVSYYKARGMDYFEERKKCRQYISRRPSEFSPLTDNEKLTGGAVFWDEYSPPPGYTWADLEGIPIPEDPMPESPKGVQISPCVLKAANLKFQQKTPISSSPIPSSQNFKDIIDQLESIQTNRKKFMEERRIKKEQKQKQVMIENDNGNQSMLMEVSAVENENESPERSVENECEFPNDEDSFVQRATQLEERVVVAVNPCRDMNIEMNRATINNSRILSPRNPLVGGNTPVTSGNRLPFRNKSKRRSDLKRPSCGRLDFSNELSGSPVKKSSTTTSPDSEESFSFDKSKSAVETNANTETPKVVIGDFADDDNDGIFSQMPMPEVCQQEQNSEKTVPVNEKSTELLSENSSTTSEFLEDSITDAMMVHLDQLEALARGEQSKAKVFTSTPLQNPNSTPTIGSGLRKSARNSTNLSAIKLDSSNNSLLNESSEKQPSKSRLSRSYVRSRK